MSSAGSQLTALPDEVVQAILGYLPAPTTVALQQTCRRFVHVANEPLLWRSYCQREWRWWDRRRHAFLTAGPSDVGVVDWKALYADRHTSAKATRTAVSHIVADDVGRLDRVASILDSGYDVKDTLLDLFVNAAASESHLAQK
jgi:F-box protein 21